VEVQQLLEQVTKGVFPELFGKKEEVKVTIEAWLKAGDND